MGADIVADHYPLGWLATGIRVTLLAVFLLSVLVLFRFRSQWDREQRAKRNLCISCGYDLTANTSGVCPECGTPVPKAPVDKSPRTA